MGEHAHSLLIDRLGGTVTTARAAAAHAGRTLSSQTVSQWRTRGIAYEWRPTLAVLLAGKDIEVPTDFLLPPAPRTREAASA